MGLNTKRFKSILLKSFSVNKNSFSTKIATSKNEIQELEFLHDICLD